MTGLSSARRPDPARRLAMAGCLVGLFLAVLAAVRAQPAAVPDPQSGPLRVHEMALQGPSRNAGPFQVQPIGFTWPIEVLVGPHADVAPEGSFARLRVQVVNTEATFNDFNSEGQRLRLADGRFLAPARQPMLIARQPALFSLPARGLLQFDLWFDVPTGARPVAAELSAGSARAPRTATFEVQPAAEE